jgi:hypothetical protein
MCESARAVVPLFHTLFCYQYRLNVGGWRRCVGVFTGEIVRRGRWFGYVPIFKPTVS